MTRRTLNALVAAMVLLSPMTVTADDIDAFRVAPWYGLIHDISDPDKMVLSVVDVCTPDPKLTGWEIEYGKAPDRSAVRKYSWYQKAPKETPVLVCQLPEDGTWYVGVILLDDADGTDQVTLSHEWETIGIVKATADDDEFTMFVVEDPIDAAAGDEIQMTLGPLHPDCHRLRSLVLWRTPITRPDLEIRDFTVSTLRDGASQASWWTELEVDPGDLSIDLSGPGGTQTYPVESAGSVHRVIFDDLVQGASYQGVLYDAGATYLTFDFVAGLLPVPVQSVERVIPLRVDEPTDSPRTAWPVSSGVPFPPGELGSVDHLSLYDGDDGQHKPLQAEVLSRWPDNSIQWVLVSFLADTDPTVPARYELRVTNSPPGLPPLPSNPVTAQEQGDTVTLENGLIRIQVGGDGGLTDRIWVDRNGDGLFTPAERATFGGRHDLVVVNEEGLPFHLDPPDEVELLSQGPLQAEVLLAGWQSDVALQTQMMRYRLRVRMYADNPVAELTYTLDVNGPYEMNRLKRLSLHLRVNNAQRGSIGTRPPVLLGPQPQGQAAMTVLQDYDFKRLVDGVREGGIGNELREEGFAWITANASDPSLQVIVAVEDFWQTYPKGLALVNDGLRIDLMPQLDELQYVSSGDPDDPDIQHVHSLFYWCERQVQYPGTNRADRGAPPDAAAPDWGVAPGFGGQYKLRLGTRVRSTIRLAFVQSTEPPAATARHLIEPLFAAADPDAYLRSTWFGDVDPVVPGFFTHYESMVSRWYRRIRKVQYIDVNNRSNWNYYGRYGAFGWMNYGDSYPEQRGYSWRNQEYDYPWAVLLQFARTGRTDLLWFAERGARHLATIDIRHHASEDQPWAPADWVGLPWKHSIGHVGGFFPNPFYVDPEQLPQWAAGCQDPFGHVVLDGLYTAGFLTGEREYLAAADRAADKIAELAGKGYSTSPWGFEFTQLRRPGWVISNMSVAYTATTDPYLLHAARMARDRTLMRQTPYDPVSDTGGSILIPWFGGETGEEIYGTTYGTGVLGESLVRLDRLAPDSRTPDSMRDFARSLIHTNYKPSIWDFWYYNPGPPIQWPPTTENSNWGTIVMSTLAAGFDAEPTQEMCRVQNVLMYLTSYYSGRQAPDASNFGYSARSLPEALYTMRRWGFANTAALPGQPPLDGPDAWCQYPCTSIQPGAPGCGSLPREVCGDGFDNDLDGDFDESGFYADATPGYPPPPPPYDPPEIFETPCPEQHFECEPGELAPCGSDVGTCQSGLMVCLAPNAWGPCTGHIGPRDEQPDGLDNDCDGMVDENMEVDPTN